MIIIFFHIGKCGGSVIRDIFKNSGIKMYLFNSSGTFENHIKNINMNEDQYIEVHAGTSISFFDCKLLLLQIKQQYLQKCFIFTTIRNPIDTICSLYNYFMQEKVINVSIDIFKKTYNNNYITNYLLTNNTIFGTQLNINPNVFNLLKIHMDVIFDYICDIRDIDNLLMFMNLSFNLSLPINNKIINISTKCAIPEMIDYNSEKLKYDTLLFKKYKHNFCKKIYIGTCRIHGGSNFGKRSLQFQKNNSSEIGELVSFTNTTQEHLQLLNFILGNIHIPEPMLTKCFRTCYLKKNNNVPKNIKLLYDQSEIMILEICSRKNYKFDNFSCCFDYYNANANANANIIMITQTNEEIKNDLVEIMSLWKKPILVVGHYGVNISELESRTILNEDLEIICKSLNIPFLNNSYIQDFYSTKLIMEKDLVHFTEFGMDIITRCINYKINEIMSNVE